MLFEAITRRSAKTYMLGTLRYVLALLVVHAHLWRGHGDYTAHFAVFCFYMISGYLMTRILAEVYPHTREGILRFAANRFLRLYPGYYVIFLCAAAVCFTAPDFALSISGGMEHMKHASARQWIYNLIIFGITGWRDLGADTVIGARMINNAWSLSIELWFYALMALGLSRKPSWTYAWLTAALVHLGWGFYRHYGFYDFYLPVTAGLLPFAIGASIYWGLKSWRMPERRAVPWIAGALALWLLLVIAAHGSFVDPGREGLYLSLIPNALLVVGLLHLKPASFSRRVVDVDRMLGNIAYPLFLMHWTVGVVVKWAFHIEAGPDKPIVFLVALVPLHFFSWLLYAKIERPIEKWRARVRPGPVANPVSPPHALPA